MLGQNDEAEPPKATSFQAARSLRLGCASPRSTLGRTYLHFAYGEFGRQNPSGLATG